MNLTRSMGHAVRRRKRISAEVIGAFGPEKRSRKNRYLRSTATLGERVVSSMLFFSWALFQDPIFQRNRSGFPRADDSPRTRRRQSRPDRRVQDHVRVTALCIHDALQRVSAQLLPGEDLCAFLGDVYVLCAPERVRTICNKLHEALAETGLELHSGKTRVWNKAGERPPQIDD